MLRTAYKQSNKPQNANLFLLREDDDDVENKKKIQDKTKILNFVIYSQIRESSRRDNVQHYLIRTIHLESLTLYELNLLLIIRWHIY